MISEKTPEFDLRGGVGEHPDREVSKQVEIRLLSIWKEYKTNGLSANRSIVGPRDLHNFIQAHQHWAEQEFGADEVEKFNKAYDAVVAEQRQAGRDDASDMYSR